MKIVTIRLDDDTYDKLDSMLKEIGQTKQTFYETYRKAVINKECVPFINKDLSPLEQEKSIKMKAYEKLENLKRNSPINEDFDKEREEAMNEKYGVIN